MLTKNGKSGTMRGRRIRDIAVPTGLRRQYATLRIIRHFHFLSHRKTTRQTSVRRCPKAAVYFWDFLKATTWVSVGGRSALLDLSIRMGGFGFRYKQSLFVSSSIACRTPHFPVLQARQLKYLPFARGAKSKGQFFPKVRCRLSHVAFKVRTVPRQTTAIFARKLFPKIVSSREKTGNVDSLKNGNLLLFIYIFLKDATEAVQLRSHPQR